MLRARLRDVPVGAVRVGAVVGVAAGVVAGAAGDGVGQLQLALRRASPSVLLGLGAATAHVLERLDLGERLRWLGALRLRLVITAFEAEACQSFPEHAQAEATHYFRYQRSERVEEDGMRAISYLTRRTTSGVGSRSAASFNSGTFVGVACLYDRTARNGLPTPAVPVRVAPASCQSKWAGPRVSALGAALATAPFPIAVLGYWQWHAKWRRGKPTLWLAVRFRRFHLAKHGLFSL